LVDTLMRRSYIKRGNELALCNPIEQCPLASRASYRKMIESVTIAQYGTNPRMWNQYNLSCARVFVPPRTIWTLSMRKR
jgi:hypothetical protein